MGKKPVSIDVFAENPNAHLKEALFLAKNNEINDFSSEKETGLEGFEPPAFGLEARRYILAKPQARRCDALYYGFFL